MNMTVTPKSERPWCGAKTRAGGRCKAPSKQPDPDLVAALVREKLLGNGPADRASAPPTADELGAAVDKAFKDYDGTKH